MTLLHFGLAAAGLACIAIPILIHLLMRRRRKPVMWGAMRFLLEAYRRQKRRLLIEKWLLLAARCLLIALIALAIGRPLIGALAARGQGRTVWLLIDDSVSAGAIGPDGRTALAVTKDRAAATISALESSIGEGARIGLITLASPARAVVNPPSTDLAAVRALVEALEPADSRADFDGAFALLAGVEEQGQDEAARSGRTQQVVILSQFREGAADLSRELPDLPGHFTLLAAAPSQAPLANVTIEEVRPLRSVVVTESGAGALAGESVTVRLSRSGAGVDDAQVSTVRVRVASAAGAGNEAQRQVRFAPGQREATTVVTLSGAGAAENGRLGPDHGAVLLARVDNDALPADNVFRQPVEVREGLRVGVVSARAFGGTRIEQFDPGAWIRLALRPGADQGIEVVEIEPAALDQARLAALDALFIPRPDLLAADSWARVRFFAESTGLVIVSPPPDATVHLWADAMIDAFDLPWTLPREAIVNEDGWTVAAPAGEEDAPGLLALIGGELVDLVKPVRVHRVLPPRIEPGTETAGEVLLTLEDGAVLARADRLSDGAPAANGNAGQAVVQHGRGLLVYLATAIDLDWTNLPTRPLMLPLLQEIVRQGVGEARGSWALVAGDRPAVPARTVELVPAELGGAREPGERLPIGTDGLATEAMRRAGVWRALDDRGGSRGLLAVNVDATGGRLGVQPADPVGTWLSQAGGAVTWLGAEDEPFEASLAAVFGQTDEGAPISLPLLAAALALAVFELFLARWSSHASITSGGSAAEAAGGSGSGAGA